MMHDGIDMFDDYDIYTITFNDGISKQVYYKVIPNSGGSADTEYRLVDTETFLGNSIWHNPAQDGFVINTENKTATNAYISSTEFESYLQTQYSYNYFQNSNLSAWKVWYCLDNDKSRFAWADDSVDEDIPATITSGNVVYVRDTTKDDETKEFPYGWISDSFTWRYTRTTTPNVSDVISNSHDNPGRNPSRVQSYTPAHEGTGLPNGRGVIYRLIDEWNNDCPCDFKNILYLRKVTNGEIDAQGTDTYIPTFCLYDIGNDEYKDASIFAIEYPDDEGKTRPCNNIFIGSILAIDRSIDSGIYALPQNIILAKVEKDDTGWSSRDITLVNVFMCNFTNSTSHVIYLSSSNKTYVGDNNTIISQGKRVVWENIS